MASTQLAPVLRHVRSLLDGEGVKSLSDSDLLQQFVVSRDEAAFAELLRRYGPLVRSTCRRVLGHEHDAEDAFQAAFLVLARRAASIRKSQALGAWICRVAQRIATKAGKEMSRRRMSTGHVAVRSQAEPATEVALRELQDILLEEVHRLPEKYQAPFLLCCLDGKSGAEAARQLGWKEGTVSGRLTEARKLLRARLGKRGIKLPAALCLVGLTQPVAMAAVPLNLARSTLTAAVRFAAKSTPASGVVSGQALALAEGMLRMAAGAKVLATGTLFLIITLLGLGLGATLQPGSASPASTPAANGTGTWAQRRTETQDAVSLGQASIAPSARLDRFGDPLPDGALARFGTVRLRQGLGLLRVLFSPDGKTLALSGIGRPLGLWDVASGKEVRQFHQQNVQTNGIAFSPDGTLLAEGAMTVRLWDTKTGALRRESPALQGSQCAVIFSPDGKMLISGGHDNLIHLWSVQSGEKLGTLEGHTASVLTFAVTKDGSVLASAGSDKVIRLWDLANGHRRKQIGQIMGLQEEHSYFNELSFSPDGRWLASAEREGNAPARVWDVRTGAQRFQLAHARTIAFSGDGRLLASGHTDGAIRLWDPATGKELRHWKSPRDVRGLAFSPNGKQLASIRSLECAPHLWDVATGTETHLGDTHRGMIRQICLTADGKSLLSLAHDRKLIQWDLAAKTPRCLMEVPLGNRWNDYYHQLSPDARVLAQASRTEKTVNLLDPQTGKPLRDPVKLDAEPYYLLFSPDGRTLAIGGQKGGLYLWNWRRDNTARKFATTEKSMIFIHFFTPDGKQLVTGSMDPNDLFVHLWDAATGKRVFSLPGNSQFPTGAISPDGKWAVGAANRDREIHVFDVARRKEVRTVPVPERINSGGLAFSPDGQLLACGEHEADGGRITLLDFATGQLVVSFQGQHSGIGQLLFSPDGRSLFSGAGDSTVMHWDATGRFGKRPFHSNLQAAWDALAGAPKAAYPACWDFIDSPKEAIALFREHIKPVKVPDSNAFQKLVQALDSGSFEERQNAIRAIEAMGLNAEPLLRKQLEANNALEVQRRLQALHDGLMKSPAWLRTRRVLHIVADIPSDDGRAFLEKLAGGDPQATLTREAREALVRMRKSAAHSDR